MTVEDILKMIEEDESGCIYVSKELMRNLGNDAAIVYAELLCMHSVFKKEENLLADGYFSCSVDYIEKNCNVSKAQQNKIFKSLAEKGLVRLDYRGLPKRRYVYLCGYNEQ